MENTLGTNFAQQMSTLERRKEAVDNNNNTNNFAPNDPKQLPILSPKPSNGNISYLTAAQISQLQLQIRIFKSLSKRYTDSNLVKQDSKSGKPDIHSNGFPATASTLTLPRPLQLPTSAGQAPIGLYTATMGALAPSSYMPLNPQNQYMGGGSSSGAGHSYQPLNSMQQQMVAAQPPPAPVETTPWRAAAGLFFVGPRQQQLIAAAGVPNVSVFQPVSRTLRPLLAYWFIARVRTRVASPTAVRTDLRWCSRDPSPRFCARRRSPDWSSGPSESRRARA
jgi:hypothetical protein